MPPRRKKIITTKEVSKILKVNSEVVSYLRLSEGLPSIKDKKYILFSEPEVVRWRNKKLAECSENVMDLKEYYYKIGLNKFYTYEQFTERASEKVFLDGDTVIQYLKRQNPAKDVEDVVGDMMAEYWASKIPLCKKCGKKIISTLNKDFCHVCRDSR